MKRKPLSSLVQFIPPTRFFESDLVGHTNGNFWTVFQTFLTKYGKVKPTDIEDNYERFRATWDHTSPIKNIFGEINNAHEYSIFVNKTIKDSTLVHMAEIIFLKAVVFPTIYKD